MSPENKKRILIFSTAYTPFIGGAEIAVKEITDRLGDFFDFDLITARFDRALPKVETVGNITVYRLGIGYGLFDKLWLPWGGALKVWQLKTKNQYDFFWCIMASFGAGAAYISNIFSRIKTPVVLTLQEGDSERHLGTRWLGLINISWRLALSRTTTVTAISSYLAERAKKLGFKGEPHIVPNGVGFGEFIFTSSENKKFKNLVTTSRLVHKNGIDLVVRALSLLPDDIIFNIYGIGGEENSLKKLAKDLGVADRVILKGFVDQKDLATHLAQQHPSDIFIRASRSEGLGNSFLEAMALGLPVVAPLVGGIKDFLVDKSTGFVIKEESPESIAEVIKYIQDENHKAEVSRVINHAYEQIKTKYDWNNISLQMKDIFQNK